MMHRPHFTGIGERRLIGRQAGLQTNFDADRMEQQKQEQLHTIDRLKGNVGTGKADLLLRQKNVLEKMWELDNPNNGRWKLCQDSLQTLLAQNHNNAQRQKQIQSLITDMNQKHTALLDRARPLRETQAQLKLAISDPRFSQVAPAHYNALLREFVEGWEAIIEDLNALITHTLAYAEQEAPAMAPAITPPPAPLPAPVVPAATPPSTPPVSPAPAPAPATPSAPRSATPKPAATPPPAAPPLAAPPARSAPTPAPLTTPSVAPAAKVSAAPEKLVKAIMQEMTREMPRIATSTNASIENKWPTTPLEEQRSPEWRVRFNDVPERREHNVTVRICEYTGRISVYTIHRALPIAECATVDELEGVLEGVHGKLLALPPQPTSYPWSDLDTHKPGYHPFFGEGFDVEKAKPYLDDKAFMLKACEAWGDLLRYASPRLQDDKDVVLAAVIERARAVQYASERLQNDRDIAMVIAAHCGDYWDYISPPFQSDPEVVTMYYRGGGALKPLSEVPRTLRANKDVVLAAVQDRGLNLEFVSGGLEKDRDIVQAAIIENGSALQFAPLYQDNKDIVLLALKDNGYALQYASEKLRDDRDVILATVQVDGSALQYASERLRNDRAIVQTAIDQTVTALEFASAELRADKALVLPVLKIWGRGLKFTPALADDEEVVDAAVDDEVIAYEFSSLKYRSNKNRAIDAVESRGRMLEFVSEELQDDYNVVKAAVINDGDAYQFASENMRKNPTIIMHALDGELGHHNAAKYFPAELAKNPEFMRERLSRNGAILMHYPQYQKSKEHVMAAVRNYGPALEWAPDFQNDREVVLHAADSAVATSLKFVSSELQDDDFIVLIACKQNGNALEFASDRLKHDRNFLLRAYNANMYSARHWPEDVCGDIDFLVRVEMEGDLSIKRVDRVPSALSRTYASDAFKTALENAQNGREGKPWPDAMKALGKEIFDFSEARITDHMDVTGPYFERYSYWNDPEVVALIERTLPPAQERLVKMDEMLREYSEHFSSEELKDFQESRTLHVEHLDRILIMQGVNTARTLQEEQEENPNALEIAQKELRHISEMVENQRLMDFADSSINVLLASRKIQLERIVERLTKMTPILTPAPAASASAAPTSAPSAAPVEPTEKSMKMTPEQLDDRVQMLLEILQRNLDRADSTSIRTALGTIKTILVLRNVWVREPEEMFGGIGPKEVPNFINDSLKKIEESSPRIPEYNQLKNALSTLKGNWDKTLKEEIAKILPDVQIDQIIVENGIMSGINYIKIEAGKKIPEGIQVINGNVNFTLGSAIVLPSTLKKVNGSINTLAHTSIDWGGLKEVTGDVYMFGGKEFFVRFPENFHIGGNADLSVLCASLPNGLQIDGDIDFGDLQAFQYASGEGVRIGGDVRIWVGDEPNNSNAFEAIREHFVPSMEKIEVGGKIILAGLDDARLESFKKNHPSIEDKLTNKE